MGSVTRRFRRTIWARNMANRAGITMPPVRMKDTEGNEFLYFSKFTPWIVYRATMLRVLRSRKQRDRTLHDQRQKTEAIKEKRTRHVTHKGSMLKRVFNKIFRRTGKRG